MLLVERRVQDHRGVHDPLHDDVGFSVGCEPDRDPAGIRGIGGLHQPEASDVDRLPGGDLLHAGDIPDEDGIRGAEIGSHPDRPEHPAVLGDGHRDGLPAVRTARQQFFEH